MTPPRCRRFALALLMAFGSVATADEFRLEPANAPAPFLDGDEVNGVIEASAVEPIGDGSRFLVAHDKHPALHVVDARTGRFVGRPIASSKFPEAIGGAPKWEGMARDSAGNDYIIGSHGGKSDPERDGKGVLIRFRLNGADGDYPTIDDASVVRWRIARGLVAALKARGLDESKVGKRKIEGLAIRERGADGSKTRELVVGLREPGDKVRAFAADITGDPKADAELELKPVFEFEAGSIDGVTSQLTSLEYVPALGGFLVVTATEGVDNVFHGNTLWFVADGTTSEARKVATFELAMKAEGLAVLGVDAKDGLTRVRLLLTYDNDPHSTMIPSRFQAATLVRESR